MEKININRENEECGISTSTTDKSDSEHENKKNVREILIPIVTHEKKIFLRMKGKEYLGYRRSKKSKQVFHDTVRPGKKLLSPCTSKQCLKAVNRFCSKIREDQRIQLHENFWNVLN